MPSALPYNYTGWHTYKTAIDEKILSPYDDASDLKLYHTFVILGYIPLLGICTGIIHIITGFAQKDLSSRFVLILRGVLEILGFGLLLIIPDLIVSIHRHFCNKAPNTHLAVSNG